MEEKEFSQASALQPDLNDAIDGVKSALERFNSQSTPENFAQIISGLGAIGLSGFKLWRDGAAYTKKHPIQVALGMGVLFFAVKGLLGSGHRLERKTSMADETFH